MIINFKIQSMIKKLNIPLIIFGLLLAFPGLAKKKEETVRCTFTGLWNEGAYDRKLSEKGISNHMATCYRPRKNSRSFDEISSGFLDKKNTQLTSLHYRFLTNGKWNETRLFKNDIQRIMKENNIENFEDLMLIPGTDTNHDLVKKILEKENKRFKGASAITIAPKGIQISADSTFWVNNDSKFETMELKEKKNILLPLIKAFGSFSNAKCQYAGNSFTWECKLPECILPMGRGALNVCQASVACTAEDQPSFTTIASCRARLHGGCPQYASHCINDPFILPLEAQPLQDRDSQDIEEPQDGSSI